MMTSGLHPHNAVALTLQTKSKNAKKEHNLQPFHKHSICVQKKKPKRLILLETIKDWGVGGVS